MPPIPDNLKDPARGRGLPKPTKRSAAEFYTKSPKGIAKSPMPAKGRSVGLRAWLDKNAKSGVGKPDEIERPGVKEEKD
jgi:hypothetical protein